MNSSIDLQIAYEQNLPVNETLIISWAQAALKQENTVAELTIRIVDDSEITELNRQYRNQNKSTNVLAFPAELPDEVDLDIPLLGDVIICPPVLEKESSEQQKPLEHHWAHIVIHGVLHLLGYDHIDDNDAQKMEEKEKTILSQFSIPDPYNLEGVYRE